MRARFIDFPKYSCIIGRIWLTLAKSLESVVFIEKAANFSLKLLIFKDFCKYNLLIIKCLTIEFYFLSSTKIIPISEYDFSAIPVRYISQQAYAKKCLQVGDIIIEKSGGSPTQSTGRVSLVSQELLDHAGDVICSNFCTAFRVKKGWNPLYVYYYLQFIYNLGAFFNFEGKTSGIKNLQLDAAFAAIPTEDISESIQNNIVVILQGLEKKIAINRQINQNLPLPAHSLREARVRLAA